MKKAFLKRALSLVRMRSVVTINMMQGFLQLSILERTYKERQQVTELLDMLHLNIFCKK